MTTNQRPAASHLGRAPKPVWRTRSTRVMSPAIDYVAQPSVATLSDGTTVQYTDDTDMRALLLGIHARGLTIVSVA